MTAKVQKWGNSLAVRLPREMARRLALTAGSGIVIREEMKRVVIQKIADEQPKTTKNVWRQFVIPIARKKGNVSGNIDQIVYGIPH